MAANNKKKSPQLTRKVGGVTLIKGQRCLWQKA